MKVYFILFGYVCFIFGRIVQPAPTSIPKWKRPCGSSDVQSTFSPIKIDLKSILDALKEHTAHFTSTVSAMKTKYTPPLGTRVTGPTLIQRLQSSDIPGLHISNEDPNYSNMTKVFLDDYAKISNLAVFLEQIMLDEANFEYNEFKSWMNHTESTTYDVLCNLDIAIHSVVNTTISDYVERDVMSESWRSINGRTIRFMRDYVVFHKAEHFGNLLQAKYSLLSFQSMTE